MDLGSFFLLFHLIMKYQILTKKGTSVSTLVRTGLSIITGFFLKKNNDDSKYIHCFLPYIVIVGIEPVANSFLFFLYNSITLLFLLKSKTDSTINPCEDRFINNNRFFSQKKQ